MMSWGSLSQEQLASTFLQMLPIWLFGAVVGLLLPRPKSWGSTKATLLMASPMLSRGLLVCHAALILREIWTHCTHPGTFRGLARATVQWLSGNGWTFTWPAHAAAASSSSSSIKGADADAAAAEAASSSARADNWYVGEKDLAFFKYHAIQGGPVTGASPWQLMMQKDVPGLVRYTSWRRSLPDGKTEYKSVTVSPGASAREFSDMYLDDDFRRNWDGMVYHHEVLEHGDFSRRQQVVRWVRRFPFAFLSDRQYSIARAEFVEAGEGEDAFIYGLSKAVPDHPRQSRDSSVASIDIFWSMWRSRTVADPWGGPAPACETVLLHHEQFKIPENLARFAVKHGMWGFVKKLASTVPVYVEARRKRVGPTEADPQAYGAGCTPNPPAAAAAVDDEDDAAMPSSSCCSELQQQQRGHHHHMRHSDSAASFTGRGGNCYWAGGSGGSECGSDDSARPGHGHVAAGGSSSNSGPRRVRNAAVVLVAGGIALAIKAHSGGAGGSSSSGGRGGGSSGKQQQRRHQRRQLASHVLADVPEAVDE